MITPFLFNPASRDDWQDWAGDNLTAIVAIVVVLVVVDWVFRRFVMRFLRRAIVKAAEVRREDPVMVQRRAETLTATLSWAFAIIMGFLGIGLILSQLGLNVAALIASVGVVGIALGLGAQTLVKDIINGIFILVEDQYGVGDVVQVAGVSGVVVEINPRRTVLRDQDGNLHIVPNSAISVATNMTRGFSRINLDIPVAFGEDVDRVTAIVNAVCDQLAQERQIDIIQPPKVLRVDSLVETGFVLKVVGDVRTFTQWDLTGELRRRIMIRFGEEGIDTPHPSRVTVIPPGGTRSGPPPVDTPDGFTGG